MESFSEHLKRQREERKIRLSDVAVQTRISLKFLEAIEAGNFEILPKTYIRAFIRDYAAAIGLDPDETMKRFDLYLESLSPQAQKVEADTSQKEPGKSVNLTRTQKIAAAIGGVIVLVVLSYLAFSPTRKPSPDLNSYGRMQELNQRKFDSAYNASAPAKGDSARLVLSASDTVWVNLVIDDGRTYDLLMKPGTEVAFWGKKKFKMTIGNAGGLSLSLNGREYPPLGKTGVVIRNLTIYKDGTLKK
ncbi:MAG: DUF4115 domain-containing protein [Bacteroidetes bacterium]|nr:DUF4115 domain-containing protein [Bacteroidota bacterium]